jgi:hypothetical protein
LLSNAFSRYLGCHRSCHPTEHLVQELLPSLSAQRKRGHTTTTVGIAMHDITFISLVRYSDSLLYVFAICCGRFFNRNVGNFLHEENRKGKKE